MNNKKAYIWRLATFLHSNSMFMSGEELAEHLNRNKFLTDYGLEYQGARGTYTLIRNTWLWLHNELNMPNEAEHVAKAFVTSEGKYAYE